MPVKRRTMEGSVSALRPGCEERPLAPQRPPTSTFAAFCDKHEIAATGRDVEGANIVFPVSREALEERAQILTLKPRLAAWQALDTDAEAADLGIASGRVRIAVFADVVVEFWRAGKTKVEAQVLRRAEEDDWLKTSVGLVEDEGDHLLALGYDHHPYTASKRLWSPVAGRREIDEALGALVDMAMAENLAIDHVEATLSSGIEPERCFPNAETSTIRTACYCADGSEPGEGDECRALAKRLVKALDCRGHQTAIIGAKPWRASSLYRFTRHMKRQTEPPPASQALRIAARMRRERDDGRSRRRLEAMVELFEERAARRAQRSAAGDTANAPLE